MNRVLEYRRILSTMLVLLGGGAWGLAWQAPRLPERLPPPSRADLAPSEFVKPLRLPRASAAQPQPAGVSAGPAGGSAAARGELEVAARPRPQHALAAGPPAQAIGAPDRAPMDAQPLPAGPELLPQPQTGPDAQLPWREVPGTGSPTESDTASDNAASSSDPSRSHTPQSVQPYSLSNIAGIDGAENIHGVDAVDAVDSGSEHGAGSSGTVVLPGDSCLPIRVPRANTSGEGQCLMQPYLGSAANAEPTTDLSGRRPPATTLLPTPWWDAHVRQPLNSSHPPLPVSISSLNQGALHFSSYVRVVAVAPRIEQTELVKELARFDWRAFLETTYDDVNEPVGNTLTTGNNESRFKDRTWSLDGGLRRRNAVGGELEMFQRFGYQDNNSRFLDPNPQRTSRLELRYTQPLLRGAGRAYNESQIVVAQIQAAQASDEVAERLEAHLVKVTEAYWELYQYRAELLQRQKLLASAERISANLQARQTVDGLQRQVFRARTAVAKRKTETIRTATVIRNTESRLRLLVNDPELLAARGREFTPLESPRLEQLGVDLGASLQTALVNRPDISAAIRQIRTAAVQLGVSQKDVLPQLDLVTSTYVAGLAAGSRTGRPFSDQFADGRPSFAVGFQFELPIGNRAARAEVERRQWELNRAFNSFRLTVEEALTNVELAVREVETTYREVLASHRAMTAAAAEAAYLEDRWKTLPGATDSAAQLLENLLDAQERLADEETALVRAQVAYVLALVRLKSEMGTLLVIAPLTE